MYARELALLCAAVLAAAQARADALDPPGKPKPSFRDPLDGAFDMSERIIQSGAFVPVPIVITEPALGSLGGGMAPVFIDRNPPPTLPNITAVAGACAANDSWFVGGGRVATLPRHGLRYTLAGPRYSRGLQYGFAKRKVKPQEPGDLPSFVTDTSLDSVVSALGPVVEFDARDTIFTPDQGVKAHVHFDWSDDFTRRWSGVFFAGLGKAFDDASEFGDADLVYGYGAGFRYLIARKFKLRMGLDVARGPEKWAYYIVFGTAWRR